MSVARAVRLLVALTVAGVGVVLGVALEALEDGAGVSGGVPCDVTREQMRLKARRTWQRICGEVVCVCVCVRGVCVCVCVASLVVALWALGAHARHREMQEIE